MRGLLLIVALAISLTACDQKGSVESTKERARAEEEANNQVQNDNQVKKAQIMEVDLANLHVFYGALEGSYEGTLRAGKDTYNIKITLARSVPPYSRVRTRQLSEIESDLNNLFFHVQVVQWDPVDPATAFGCRVSGIKPNMEIGALTIASVDCPNLYSIFLSEGGQILGSAGEAPGVASKVRNRAISQVPYLVGYVQPSSKAGEYTFSVKKNKVRSAK